MDWSPNVKFLKYYLEFLRIENSEYTIPKILLKRLDMKFCELSELVAGC